MVAYTCNAPAQSETLGQSISLYLKNQAGWSEEQHRRLTSGIHVHAYVHIYTYTYTGNRSIFKSLEVCPPRRHGALVSSCFPLVSQPLGECCFIICFPKTSEQLTMDSLESSKLWANVTFSSNAIPSICHISREMTNTSSIVDSSKPCWQLWKRSISFYLNM